MKHITTRYGAIIRLISMVLIPVFLCQNIVLAEKIKDYCLAPGSIFEHRGIEQTITSVTHVFEPCDKDFYDDDSKRYREEASLNIVTILQRLNVNTEAGDLVLNLGSGAHPVRSTGYRIVNVDKGYVPHDLKKSPDYLFFMGDFRDRDFLQNMRAKLNSPDSAQAKVKAVVLYNMWTFLMVYAGEDVISTPAKWENYLSRCFSVIWDNLLDEDGYFIFYYNNPPEGETSEPSPVDKINELMLKYFSENISETHTFRTNSGKPVAVAFRKKTKKEPSGAMKEVGPALDEAIIMEARGKEAGWMDKANGVEVKEYTRFKIKAKILQVDDLLQGLTAWHFRDNSNTLVIVIPSSLPSPPGYPRGAWVGEGEVEGGFLDELIYHEFREDYWIGQGLSQHEAHVLASAEEVMEFAGGDKLTTYHQSQLENMTAEQLQFLIKEYYIDRDYHRSIIENHLNRFALLKTNLYELYIIKETRRLLIEKISGRSALQHSEIETGLLELCENEGGYLVSRFIEGPSKIAYFDWGGTLDSLTPDERSRLFRFLHARGFEINIITAAGDPNSICAILNREGALHLLNSVVFACGTGYWTNIARNEACPNVKIVTTGNTKQSYLKRLEFQGKAMLFDDHVKNFAWPASRVIRVGVVVKKDGSLDYLLGGEPFTPAHYYIYSLRDIDSLAKLLCIINEETSAIPDTSIIPKESKIEEDAVAKLEEGVTGLHELRSEFSRLGGIAGKTHGVSKLLFAAPIELLKNTPDFTLALKKMKMLGRGNSRFQLIIYNLESEIDGDKIIRDLKLPNNISMGIVTKAEAGDGNIGSIKNAIKRKYPLGDSDHLMLTTNMMSSRSAEELKDRIGSMSGENVSVGVVVESGEESVVSLSKILADLLSGIGRERLKIILPVVLSSGEIKTKLMEDLDGTGELLSAA